MKSKYEIEEDRNSESENREPQRKDLQCWLRYILKSDLWRQDSKIQYKE